METCEELDVCTARLYKDGFIVKENQNEDLLTAIELNRKIYGSELNLIILASENCNFKYSYCLKNLLYIILPTKSLKI